MKLRPNFLLLASTFPVFFVLLLLPIQQEVEDSLLGKRASFEDRVSVIAEHPDFVIHATSKGGAYRSALILHKMNTEEQEYQSGLNMNLNHLEHIVASNKDCSRILPNSRNRTERHKLPFIKDIRIVGERNSGAQTLREHLAKAILLKNITIESGITRFGYWFQDFSALNLKNFKHGLKNTLVIHIAGEPYEWFKRMKANPIHAPYHTKFIGSSSSSPKLRANWTSDSFFTRPWTCPRPKWDDEKPAIGHCQFRFPYGHVIPCLPGKFSGTKSNKLYPVYEMNPKNLHPFANVMQLRSAKITNFLNISNWMPNVLHVRGPDVMNLKGMNLLLMDIVERYRITACELKSFVRPPSWSDNPPLSHDNENLITCGLDWYVEKELGFAPQSNPKKLCGGKKLVGEGGLFDYGEGIQMNNINNNNLKHTNNGGGTLHRQKKTVYRIFGNK